MSKSVLEKVIAFHPKIDQSECHILSSVYVETERCITCNWDPSVTQLLNIIMVFISQSHGIYGSEVCGNISFLGLKSLTPWILSIC